jgi:predicted transcriptional regulator of viral defense system
MEGLSKKEIEIISWLEFYKKYFFTSQDIDRFSRNKTHRYNIIKNLLKKKRIFKLNMTKYYLVPIKAKSGGLAEDSFIIADEVFNGKNYFIGGWAAANYWRLTEQIPMKIEIYSTKRQGIKKLLGTTFIFRRTTKKMTDKAVIEKISEHQFRILSRNEVKKWMKQKK